MTNIETTTGDNFIRFDFSTHTPCDVTRTIDDIMNQSTILQSEVKSGKGSYILLSEISINDKD